MQVFRRSRFWSLLALLAIAVQLLLPVRHAAMLAHTSGDPLQAAFCGKASAAALRQLQASAPAELSAALHLRSAQNQVELDADGCQFCNASAGVQVAALASSAPLLSLLSLNEESAPAPIHIAPSLPAIPLPPGRGPPLTT